jgi:hypothetical protein
MRYRFKGTDYDSILNFFCFVSKSTFSEHRAHMEYKPVLGRVEKCQNLDFCLGFHFGHIFHMGWVLKRSPVMILDLKKKLGGQPGQKTDFP